MTVTVSKADDGAIEFFHGGGLIYDICSAMQQRSDLGYWLQQIGDNQWASKDVLERRELLWE